MQLHGKVPNIPWEQELFISADASWVAKWCRATVMDGGVLRCYAFICHTLEPGTNLEWAMAEEN
jgi:hypothetical protein